MSQNKERLTTPAGEAKYPRLNTPDTKWKKEGQYKVTLVLDESDPKVTKFLSEIRRAEKAAVAEAQRNPKNKKLKLVSVVREHTDKEGNVIEGKVEVTFKTTASGVRDDGTKWERKIRMFDAKGHPTEAKVGSGSTIKVSYTMDTYATTLAGIGLSLYLEAVQILELVEFKGEADAGDYGFGEEEGSFEADGAEFAEDADSNIEEQTEEESLEEVDAPAEEDEPAEEKAEPDPEPAPRRTAKPSGKPAPKPASKPAPQKNTRARGDF